MYSKIQQICYCFWLHRQNFNCFKFNKWWSLYYFVCMCCWSTNWNSRSNFYSSFFSNNRNNKKITEYNKKQKEKDDKVLLLAKSKLSSIETLLSQALIDMEISHEEFIMILGEKNKCKKMKENLRNVTEKHKNMRLSSVDSKK